MSEATNAARPHDVVIFGATGFVGRLVAEYLAEQAPEGVRIALAGRSRQRLEEVRAALPARAHDWPLVTADVADPTSLRQMAESTTALASTVGPYLRYGVPVVQACADSGTHYADLTGEVLFVRKAIDAVEARARETGARIVTACGYDSIPSDLGVLLLHQRAVADAAGGLLDTTLHAKSKGGLSGGTIDSSRAQLEAVGEDRALRKVLFDPYALSPDRAAEPDLGKERDPRSVFADSETGEWVGPFVMAGFNTRIVRRSNALRDHAYGRLFRYREVSAYGRGLRGRRRATVFTAAMGLAFAGLANPRTRPIFDRLAPSPGEGPSEQNRRSGWFSMKIRTTTETGRRYLATVSAQGDPGYAATAVMLGESALCLALDSERLPPAAGVLTPATAMGDALVERLRAREFVLTVDELSDRP